MATSPLRLQQGYGIGNALQPLPPFSIIANRAPTQQDKARIGTFWVYTALNNVYVLTSVTGGVSNWLTLSNGGAGVFLSLTVNGPSTFAGNITQTAGVTSLLATTINGSLTQNNGNTVLNSDANASTIQIGTGLAAKNIQIGNQADVTVRALGGKFQITDNAVSTTPSLFIQSSAAAGAFSCLDTFQLLDGSADIRSLRFTPTTIAPVHQFFKAKANPATGAGANVANGDVLGQFDFEGFRQTGALADNFSTGAQIQSLVTDVDAAAGTISSNFRFITRNPGAALTVKATITETGEFQINTAGKTLGIKQGADAMAGTVVLDGLTGSFTQANTQVTNANSIILLSRVNVNGASGAALTYTILDNTSFTVTARDATTGLAVNTDASTIAYMIVQRVP